MKKILIILVIILGFTFVPKKGMCQIHTNQIAIESFESFYQKFYYDSIFQSSRISWPLDGGVFIENSELWNKSTWKRFLKTPKLLYKEYNFNLYSLNKIDDLNYTEIIGIENSGMGMEYKYKKIGNKWFLTSCTVFSN